MLHNIPLLLTPCAITAAHTAYNIIGNVCATAGECHQSVCAALPQYYYYNLVVNICNRWK